MDRRVDRGVDAFGRPGQTRPMTTQKLTYERPVTVAGGGLLDAAMVREAMVHAPAGLIAADGAADRLDHLGFEPNAIVGDIDSLSDPNDWRRRGATVVALSEQDTTDFEKCLYSVAAPAFVGVGFTGKRLDHMLAVFHVLLRHNEKPVFLLGEVEAMALVPPGREVVLDVGVGATISLFPLAPVNGLRSQGLEWAIDGLQMAMGSAIGTSNRSTDPTIRLAVDRPGLLLFIPRSSLGALIEGVMGT